MQETKLTPGMNWRNNYQTRLHPIRKQLNWGFILSRDGKWRLKKNSSTRINLVGELERRHILCLSRHSIWKDQMCYLKRHNPGVRTQWHQQIQLCVHDASANECHECHVYADKTDRGDGQKMMKHHSTTRRSAKLNRRGTSLEIEDKSQQRCKILLQGLNLLERKIFNPKSHLLSSTTRTNLLLEGVMLSWRLGTPPSDKVCNA